MEVLNQIRLALEEQVKNGLVANADAYTRGEMAYVAALLALSSTGEQPIETVRALWPFPDRIFRPTHGREDLVEAAALLIGEILRVDVENEKLRWKPTHRSISEGKYLIRLIGPARKANAKEVRVVYEDIEKELLFCTAAEFDEKFVALD